MTEYLSEKKQQQQEEFLNDCIIKINNNIQNGVIEVKYKDDTSDIEERAFTTDTHGDLISLMGATVMCGVKFKENEFLYYDRNKGIYYEKVNGKYYEYELPYIGPKMVGEPKDSIEGILDNDKMELKKEEVNLEGYEEIDENLLRIEEGKKENTNIVVIPIPDTSNARDLYHLGDVLDRGQESLTFILLCEMCPTIKLAQGNHEFMNNMNALYNGSYVKEIKSINLILARMKINNRIVTGFYDGKDNDVISYSHIPLTENRVAGFFSFLNAVYVNNKYTNGNPTVLEALDKEFKDQNQEELYNKIKDYLNKNNKIISDIAKQNENLKYYLYSNELSMEEGKEEEIQDQIFENNVSIFENIIEPSFSKEEMLIVKNIINDALVKRRIKVEDNGKIYSIDGGAKTDIYDDYQELQGEAGNIINFDRYSEEYSICYAVKGHDYNPNSIEVVGGGKCLDIDDLKSVGYRRNKSCATITNLNIKTGTVNNYSFTAARKMEDNSIEDTFEKNIQGHQREMKLENFKLSPASISYSAKPAYKDKDDERHISILMAIDKKDINEAKRLIKLGYRINVKKLSDSEKGIFENIKDSVKNLAINCNISKEKFDSFVLSDENREETVIEKFEKLNKVLEEIAKNEEKNICCEH